MFQLPKVEKLSPKSEPKNFFIWGSPMTGKSYFSSFFPNPLILNTDGNSKQGSAPSIQLRNIRNETGGLKQSVIKQLDDIVIALQVENPKRPENQQFKTIVVDVIDDVCIQIEQAICLDAGVQALSDIPYGKGYAMFNTALQQFVMDLKALPLNVIYISRELAITDESTGATTYEPSLKTKYYNIVNGNCDVVIRTKKIGDGQNASYFREVKALRTMYNPANITDHRILQLLESCTGMFKKEDLEKLQAKKKENK
ncbi:ATP-binding protein [Lactobacillus helveticus]|uniref:ATP-binding protein n=1 Tax=Lactobacillus helveticus TaxID=1587 RepID=UPI0021A2DB6C|nr:ATP-binding protein [Lactobacillus helveticus]MCT3415476.1 NTP-binding protein [Lactobacillus helveticus]